MNKIKEFIGAAKVKPKLWNRLSICTVKVMAFYSLIVFVTYYFTGLTYLGGEYANFPLLFLMLLVASIIVALLKIADEIRKEFDV